MKRRGAARARLVRMTCTTSRVSSHPDGAWSPDSPWPSAVARATQVHRAECSQPGRAFATIIHAGSARALATRGPAPSMSPPTRQSPLARCCPAPTGGANRRARKRRRTGKTSGLRRPPRPPKARSNRDSNRRPKSRPKSPTGGRRSARPKKSDREVVVRPKCDPWKRSTEGVYCPELASLSGMASTMIFSRNGPKYDPLVAAARPKSRRFCRNGPNKQKRPKNVKNRCHFKAFGGPSSANQSL